MIYQFIWILIQTKTLTKRDNREILKPDWMFEDIKNYC